MDNEKQQAAQNDPGLCVPEESCPVCQTQLVAGGYCKQCKRYADGAGTLVVLKRLVAVELLADVVQELLECENDQLTARVAELEGALHLWFDVFPNRDTEAKWEKAMRVTMAALKRTQRRRQQKVGSDERPI